MRFVVWNKLYSYDIAKKLLFLPDHLYEEIDYHRRLYQLVDKILYIEAPFYNYLVNREGNTQSYFKTQKLNVVNDINLFEKYIIENCKEKTILATKVYFMQFYFNLYKEAKKCGAPDESLKLLYREFRRMVTINIDVVKMIGFKQLYRIIMFIIKNNSSVN